MTSVFSHIVNKRLGNESEDVATEALAYILAASEKAREGVLAVLRSVDSRLPALWFETQQAEAGIRPDMWGLAQGQPRAFIENKFWAGLTDAQPVEYLRRLSVGAEPAVVLVVAPKSRTTSLARELKRRIGDAGISLQDGVGGSGIDLCVDTDVGPRLALTSWTHVLSALAHGLGEESGVRADVEQLRSLCDAAEEEAFVPVSAEELSDQRTPAFVLHMNELVRDLVDAGENAGIVSVGNLRPQASWEWIGRYLYANSAQTVEAWIGIHFGLWKRHGGTPLWLLFLVGGSGPCKRGEEVRERVEPWAKEGGWLTAHTGSSFAIGLDVPANEERDRVVSTLVERLSMICRQIQDL